MRGAPGRLRFAHALIRDTLYEELTPVRRPQLHRRAGEAIEGPAVIHQVDSTVLVPPTLIAEPLESGSLVLHAADACAERARTETVLAAVPV